MNICLEPLDSSQQELFDYINMNFEDKRNCVLRTDMRQIGKTRVVNELSLTYQALGYDVIIMTQFPLMEHFGWRTEPDFESIFGERSKRLNLENCIILVDEIAYSTPEQILAFEIGLSNCPIWCGGFIN